MVLILINHSCPLINIYTFSFFSSWTNMFPTVLSPFFSSFPLLQFLLFLFSIHAFCFSLYFFLWSFLIKAFIICLIFWDSANFSTLIWWPLHCSAFLVWMSSAICWKICLERLINDVPKSSGCSRRKSK